MCVRVCVYVFLCVCVGVSVCVSVCECVCELVCGNTIQIRFSYIIGKLSTGKLSWNQCMMIEDKSNSQPLLFIGTNKDMSKNENR